MIVKYSKAIARRVIAFIKLSILKIFHFKKIKFSLIEIISLSTRFGFEGKKIILGNNISTRRNVEFNTYYDGVIKIGDNSFFNNNCIVAAHKEITIGENCAFGPNVVIYDHDHDFRHVGGRKAGCYNVNPVKIGNNVWIGANCIVLRGTVIEDNTVIAAGTVVKGHISGDSVVYTNKQIKYRQYK